MADKMFDFVNGDERITGLNEAELHDKIIDAVMSTQSPSFHWEDSALVCD